MDDIKMRVWIDRYGDIVWVVWSDGTHYYEFWDGCSMRRDDIVWMILK